MSQINFTRKTFLEREEIARLQEFLRDSPSENAIIGNTSRYGILRTDFQNDTDFLVEPSSNAGRVKIDKLENKAITLDGNRIYQEAIDNIEVADDNSWYWMRIKYSYVTYEKGIVSINASGEVVGVGTQFSEVLRGQATQVPTKVKFLKIDGNPAINSGFYEVVDITNDTNIILTSAVDFVAESNLRMVVLGTTPLGEMLSTEQQEGLYKYDSCEIEFIEEEQAEVPPHLSSTNPDSTFVQDKMFYIARVRNNAGFVSVDNANPYVRAEFWEFNVVGLTDKLSMYANLSDVQNPDVALTNLGLTTAGRNIAKAPTPSAHSYIKIFPNGQIGYRTSTTLSGEIKPLLDPFFLKNTYNLSELTDTASARTNLNVYGKSEVYNKTEAYSKSEVYSKSETYNKSQNLADLPNVTTARNNLNVYSKSEAVASNVNLKREVIEIGDWDMPSLTILDITLTTISFSSIVGVDVTILSDPGVFSGGITIKKKLSDAGDFSVDVVGTNNPYVRLVRHPEGEFDSTAYNQTSYNRGWVIIDYIES